MLIKKEDIKFVDEIYLHDMELRKVSIDYLLCEIDISLVDSTGVSHELCFRNIRSLSVDRFQPWGEGYYIYSMTAFVDDLHELFLISPQLSVEDSIFAVELLMNSGDKIKILASELEYC